MWISCVNAGLTGLYTGGCSAESNCQVCNLTLSYLQAKKLDCSCCKKSCYAGRRHKTSESEKKNCFTSSTTLKMWTSVFALILLALKFYRGDAKGPTGRCHTCGVFVLQWGNNELEEPTAFPASSKLSLLFVAEGDIPSSHKTAHCKHNHEKWLG